ncbi:glycosyltransferase family 4 protein [Blastococcus sp. SYSU DS0533]
MSWTAAGRTRAVLVVGQVPPPLGGQAVMVAALLEGEPDDLRYAHVRMNFSRSLSSTGSWSIGKAVEVGSVIVRITVRRLVDRAAVLYYPPSGHGLLPILRDAVILGTTRHLFRSTVYHFHASGLTESLAAMNPMLRRAVRWALGRPDVAVLLSPSAPDEGRALGARRTVIVENGVAAPPGVHEDRPQGGTPVLTFMGLICPGKGAGRLVEISRRLHAEGVAHRLRLVGEPESPAYRAELTAAAERAGVDVEFTGVLSGEDKWRALRETTLFCFPTRFHSETSPLVVIEAMATGVPVVASRWRALPDLVEDGVTGRLVDPDDVDGWVRAIRELLADRELRAGMGVAARRRFEERHTIERFQRRMTAVLEEVSNA